MQKISLLLIAPGIFASSAAAVAELLRVDEQWGLTGKLTADGLCTVLAVVLMPYLFLMVGALLARSEGVRKFILGAIVTTLIICGFLEIPHLWVPWYPNDPSYAIGAILKYPLACLSLVIGFISFDMHRLSAEDL